MALVELSYDEIETILIALVLRQDEIMSIPKDEYSDQTIYETRYIYDLSDRLNNAQRDMEEAMGREIENVANSKRESIVNRIRRTLGILPEVVY